MFYVISEKRVTAVTYLYKEWLPKSGEKLRNFPVFFSLCECWA